MGGAAHDNPERRGNSHIVLLLSLKLILLAFFILLNALSDFETARTRAVLASVSRTFGGNVEPSLSDVSPEASLGPFQRPADLLSEVGSLFEAMVPGQESRRTAHATAMRVELPARALFRPGEARIRRERTVLVRRLARAVGSDPEGGPAYELDLLHGIAGGTPAAPGPEALEVRRLGALAERLVREGLPAEALSIGLLPGRPETLRLVVRRPAPAGAPERRPRPAQDGAR